MVENVGLEPRHVRWPAPALVDESRVGRGHCVRDQPHRLVQLILVPARLRHDRGDRMRRECDVRRAARRKLSERGAYVVGVGLDPTRMVEEHSRSNDLRRTRAYLLLRGEEVLAVLPAARVRRVGRGEERQSALDAGVCHFPQCVCQERIPVAVAEVDRQIDGVRVEFSAQRSDERAILGVDGAHATEELVVVGDVLEAFARHVASAGDVLEERHHVVHSLGTAKRDDEDRVESGFRELRNERVCRCLEGRLAHRIEPSRSALFRNEGGQNERGEGPLPPLLGGSAV